MIRVTQSCLPAAAANARALRVCMLAYTFYETDGRVMRYAEALAQNSACVDAIVLRRRGQDSQTTINGVRVLRVQSREKNERGKFDYLFRVLRFFLRSMLEVTRQHWKQPYDVIHVHSVPDFEVFATLIPKLLGAKVILDIHDIVPEFYAAKFGVSHQSLAFQALKVVERLSTGFADHVIAANDLWLDRITSRAVHRAKCSSFINYPDLTIFSPHLRRRGPGDSRFIVLYPGTLNWHQGLDIAVRAMVIAVREAPSMELHIYGEGPSKQSLEQLVRELGLSGHVFLNAPRPLRDIATVMANADIGVVPKRNDSFGGEAFSTKILEFMAVGVPVVVAETRIDRHYFDDTTIQFFEPGNHESLAQTLLAVYRDHARREALAANAQRFVQANSWGQRKQDYLGLVERLTDVRA
jgi:glycosyltransferase involved in cell wall biosynthesis